MSATEAADKAVRVDAVKALRAALMFAEADTLIGLAPITDKATARAAEKATRTIKDAAAERHGREGLTSAALGAAVWALWSAAWSASWAGEWCAWTASGDDDEAREKAAHAAALAVQYAAKTKEYAQ